CAALVNFYKAFNQRDIARMADNWWPSASASMSNPLGDVKHGWPQIETVYQKLFNGPAQVYVEFHDFSVHQTSDMFCAVGRERGWFKKNDIKLALAIRTTRIYQRVDSDWRQLHHHGSIDNSVLLHAYQAAVLNITDK
ncbi:MAG: nuclear transport factor 2 family protein, partial [Gammaproteobacteria bacterium]